MFLLGCRQMVDALLCSEQPAALRFMEAALREQGFGVAAFSHISDAVGPCLKRQYRMAVVALGDLCWKSVEEKLEPLRVLHEIDPGLPVVVVGDHRGDLELERRVREEGIFYFLTQPFDHSELQTAVSCAIQKRQRERS